MNRLFITILSFCLLVNVFAQKPSKGNVVTEVQMNLNVNNGGGFFTLENMLLPTLRFRYFLSSDLALRADLNVNSTSSTSNFFENADGTGATGEFIFKQNMYGLGLGVEKHFGGNTKFSPFVGGSFNFGLGSNTTEASNSNGGSYLADTKGESTNKTSNFGVMAFTGADYWINNSFYVGGQINLGFSATTIKEGDAETTIAGTTTKTVIPEGKTSGFGQGITPTIRLGFLFNGGVNSKTDSDGDGVPDVVDKCPNTPKGMVVSGEGCPNIVNVVRSLAKNIYFETSSDVIKSESFKSLDKVATILLANPTANLSIEGHTDSQGDDNMNMDLSKRRAQSVLNYLSKKGADVSHLVAQGFGETKPVSSNDNKEGRALNRRVEMLLSF
ncbi:MAG: hypothetical protein COA58_11925 [Bacteroidetes bacterium]|nr:MAG: hypothetical protein COA58_11925 [Bacteroidota bacterium]